MAALSRTRSGKPFKDAKVEFHKYDKKGKEDIDWNILHGDMNKYIAEDGKWVEPPANASRETLVEFMEGRNRHTLSAGGYWIVNHLTMKLEYVFSSDK